MTAIYRPGGDPPAARWTASSSGRSERAGRRSMRGGLPLLRRRPVIDTNSGSPLTGATPWDRPGTTGQPRGAGRLDKVAPPQYLELNSVQRRKLVIRHNPIWRSSTRTLRGSCVQLTPCALRRVHARTAAALGSPPGAQRRCGTGLADATRCVRRQGCRVNSLDCSPRSPRTRINTPASDRLSRSALTTRTTVSALRQRSSRDCCLQKGSFPSARAPHLLRRGSGHAERRRN